MDRGGLHALGAGGVWTHGNTELTQKDNQSSRSKGKRAALVYFQIELLGQEADPVLVSFSAALGSSWLVLSEAIAEAFSGSRPLC